VPADQAFDLVSTHISRVDSQGTITFVNRSWEAFARDNGFAGAAFVGGSYLDACERATGAEEAEARAFADDLRAVLTDRIPGFTTVYTCHGVARPRWFKALVDRCDGGAVITHVDITAERLAWSLDGTEPHGMQTLNHNLRTPLNAIRGFADLSVELQAAESLETHLDNLRQISVAANTLLSEIQDMLSNRAVTAGVGALDESACDVGAVLDTVIAALTPKAQARGVALRRSPLRGLPRLWADPVQVQAMVWALVESGLEGESAGGAVNINESVNHSRGIDLAFSYEYGPDRRAARTGEASPSGADGSFGVAIPPSVRALADRHGGVVTAARVANMGSEIVLRFPTWRTEAA